MLSQDWLDILSVKESWLHYLRLADFPLKKPLRKAIGEGDRKTRELLERLPSGYTAREDRRGCRIRERERVRERVSHH